MNDAQIFHHLPKMCFKKLKMGNWDEAAASEKNFEKTFFGNKNPCSFLLKQNYVSAFLCITRDRGSLYNRWLVFLTNMLAETVVALVVMLS